MKFNAQKMREMAASAMARLSSGQLDEDDGTGPVLLGVAAVNEPHLSHLREIEIVERDGREWLKVHIARLGIFKHPQAPSKTIVLDTPFFQRIKDNFGRNIIGRKIVLDAKHEPNDGSLGELVELSVVQDGLEGVFDPTPTGLQNIRDKIYRYASIYFTFKYSSTQVGLAFSNAQERDLFDILDTQELEEEEVKGKKGDIPPAEGDQTPVAAGAVADPGADDIVKMRAELRAKADEVKAMLAEEKAQLAADRLAFAEEQRQGRVALWVDGLEQPDSEGKCYDKGLLDAVRAALSEQSEEEGAVKLSADSSVHDVRAYYVGEIQRIVQLAARVVPTQSGIEPDDKRPGDEPDEATVKLAANRDEYRAALIQVELGKGVANVSDERMVEIDAAVNQRYPEVK